MRFPLLVALAFLVIAGAAVPAMAAGLTVQEQTPYIRTVQDQIIAQEEAIAKAEEDLKNATTPAQKSSAQAALDLAKSLLESLIQKLAQAQAPLTQSNQRCTPFKKECRCNEVKKNGTCVPEANSYLCPCQQPVPGTDHIIKGICLASLECHGQVYTNLEGQSTGVGDIGGIIGEIFKGISGLFQGGGAAGGGGGPAPRPGGGAPGL